MRTTISNINAALPEGYEIVKGKGYFYFWGPNVANWSTSSVYVYHLTAFSIEEWVSLFHQYKDHYDRNRRNGQ